MDQGLLVARLVIGLLMAAHGAQKAFGWFGGHGLSGLGMYLESLGFRPGRLFAAAAAGGEVAGGLLIALGLFGPIGPTLTLSVMIVAAITVHWKNGLFVMSNGIEVPLLYAAAAVALALTGPGRFSLDAALGLGWSPVVTYAALLAGVVGGFANLALRRTPVATA
jgi:putative oxidoreductase